MYFKRSLLVIFSALWLVSCNLPVNEEPPEAGSPEFKDLQKTQCLKDVLPAMSRFMNGSATSNEVGASWDCFESGINLFSKYVRGRQEDRYTAKELASFFQKYYLGNIPISPTLLNEIMKIKQLFVGGANNTFTRDELVKLAQFSQEMKVISLKLLPYMKIYSFNWQISGYATLEDDVHYFEDANQIIQEGAKDLATLIERNGLGYELSSIATLLSEMAKLYNSQWEIVDEIQRTLPLIYKLKRTLTGGDETTVAANEWRRFSLLSSRGYIQYLRYYYFIKGAQDIGSAPELIYVTRSFDDLFSYFGDMVGDKPGSKFTRQELLEVLTSVTDFFPKFKVSDTFLLEFMKIKMVFLGGSLDEFTPADFEYARKKLEYFRDLTERFLNYVHVYAYSWNPGLLDYDQSQKYFDRSESNLYEFGVKLGSTAEVGYDIENLKKFAEEFENLYPSGEAEFGAMKAIIQYLPMVKTFKNIVFTDESSFLTKQQIPIFLGVGAQMYSRALYYNYFLKPKRVHWTQGNGLTSLSKFIKSCRSFLDALVERKKDQVISFAELNKFIDSAFASQMFTENDDGGKLTPESVYAVAKAIFHKILIYPENRLAGKLPDGLTKQATAVLGEEFSIWADNEQYADLIFQGSGQAGLSQEAIQNALKQAADVPGLNEFRIIFDTPQSLAYDDQNRLFISHNKINYNRKSLSFINASRFLVRLGIRAYASDIKRIKNYSGITLTEANNIFADVRPALLDLKILEPDKLSFANSRYREANLFTPRGDGSTECCMNFIEGTDLVVAMLSGLRIDNMFREKILQNAPDSPNCEIGRSANSDKRQILVECFLQKFRANLSEVFSSMPEMHDYLVDLLATDEELQVLGTSSEIFNEIAINLLKASGYVADIHKDKVFITDVALVPHVMQYIETVVHRFDTDKDGILNKDEAMSSLPLFRDILNQVSGGKLPAPMIKGLLAWLLVKGKQPKGFKEYAQFVIWCFQESKWDIKADRRKLAAILGMISEAIEKKERIGVQPVKPVDEKEKAEVEELLRKEKMKKQFEEFMKMLEQSGG